MRKALTCFVTGRTFDEFTIVAADEISIDNSSVPINDFTVALLKKHIWKEISYDFEGSGIGPNRLNLWKVEIPINEENKKILENPEIEYIKQTFSLNKLSPGDMFLDKEVFPDNYAPPRRHIHILVQPPSSPATTGKRGPDEGEERGSRKKEKRTPKTLSSLLSSLVLQPHPIKIPSHKFYDRDQALNSMLEIARFNYQGRKSDGHKDHYFLLIPGGIGIGKTRMGWESQYLKGGHADSVEFREALEDPCYIFIDLNNGCKYVPGFDCITRPGIRIGARVALAYGLIPSLHYLLTVEPEVTELFELSNVIYEILQRLHPNKPSNPVDDPFLKTIIIHIDEYQLYINAVQQYKNKSWMEAREFFKDMLKEIGSVMRGFMTINTETGYTRNHGLTGKYFIIPICTGTSAIDLHFLPTEHTNKLLELCPLNYDSAKSMFLDKYDYSRQATDEGKNLVVQSLKSYHSSDLNNANIKELSDAYCNFVFNQQHFRIAMFDTGFIPKFIDDLLSPQTLAPDFDWGNQLFNKVSGRNIVKIGNDPGEWKSLEDIRTIISFGLTRQLIKRDFRLTSGMSIGELERSGLVYISNTNGEWYTVVMPFMLLKALNNKLLVSNVRDLEPVFQDNLLLIPTHDSPWEWQNFESLYGHYQKALIDSLIYVKETRINSIDYKIQELESKLEGQKDFDETFKINREIETQKKELAHQKSNNWQISDLFCGALGADTLLQRKIRLHKVKVFTENKKFLVKKDDIGSFDKLVSCDDNVTRPLDEGIFRCYRGCANIDHRWALDSADNGKKFAIFSQIKYSERDATTELSTPEIKRWYKTTMTSVRNYESEYDVILVLFTNRTCTGTIDIEEMPQLLLIYPENIEKYLSPTFAHRGLVSGPSENDY